MFIDGKVVPGHGIASGKSEDSPYPKGSIEMQIPFFKEGGLDLSSFYPGTMNINIQPVKWQPRSSDFTFKDIEWTKRHPPEHFSFIRCKLWFNDLSFESFIYYPHPETKITHFQNPSIVEIISKHIAGLEYGSIVKIEVEDSKISIL